jgi:uncharacterized membrane protein
MSEYLSKEEIKQWRSSLEKITLEEFAARLGKKIEEAKPTNDLIDIVLKGKPVVSSEPEWKQNHAERLSAIAERAYEREQQIAPTPFSVHRIQIEEEPVAEKQPKKAPAKVEKPKAEKKPVAKKAPVKKTVKAETLRDEVRIVFKKALTDREQKVFDHFAKNKGKIVYAKDLAGILDLPRDYVYKYIKNLRAKIEGDKLENADKGGFILNI